MARIYGVNLPPQKRIEAALPLIFGLGLSRSRKILKEAKLSPDIKVSDLTEENLAVLRSTLDKHGPYEGDLRRVIMAHIKRKKDVRSYQGIRHEKKLPVRGQRTRTNTRTIRGNVRRTMGSGRKSSAEKT